MTRIALIGAALTAALSTAGCLDTIAALRSGRVVEIAEEVRQHPANETVLAGLGAPLQADQGQSGGDASEATDTKLSRQVLRRKRQDTRPPALTRSSIAVKAITRRPRRPGSGSPAVTREQPPTLPIVKGATPITS